MSNNYPNNSNPNGDLPGYNDYAGGNAGGSNPFNQGNPYEQAGSYDQSIGNGYGGNNYGAVNNNQYGAPAFPNAPAFNDAPGNAPLLGNGRPGAWKRFLGLFLDSLLILIPAIILVFVIGGQDFMDWVEASSSANPGETPSVPYPTAKMAIANVLTAILWFVYRVFMESNKGGTFGKMAIGARVVSANGQNITPIDSMKRNSWYFLAVIFNLIPTVGSFLLLAVYIAVGVSIGTNSQKQSFTDQLANAYVVNK